MLDSENDDEPEILAKEETIVEDLTTPKVIVEVTQIDSWERRFKLASYSDEQKRCVNAGLDKMREWMEVR